MARGCLQTCISKWRRYHPNSKVIESLLSQCHLGLHWDYPARTGFLDSLPFPHILSISTEQISIGMVLLHWEQASLYKKIRYRPIPFGFKIDQKVDFSPLVRLSRPARHSESDLFSFIGNEKLKKLAFFVVY
jgi:hypothetical protein